MNWLERPARAGFLSALASAALALRILLADHVYFRLVQVPSHDMAQGLAYFTSTMHSLRLTGDLAWWFPGSFTGYAQYFQGFFSPLAPSWGHVVFVAWSHLMVILADLGMAVPEYYQYLVVNYAVLPWLAFAAFGYFCAQFLRHRASVALAMAAFVLSGIGLWNSAWFYFQESISLFFLLGATLALLRRPGERAVLVFLAAVLVQLASLNYWTVYNIFFVAAVLGAYAAMHWNQVRRLPARLRPIARLNPRATVVVAGAVALVAAAWGALIVGTLAEQAGSYVRLVYTSHDMLSRIYELRRFTTELFNPSLARAIHQYYIPNELHNARYIGIALLPLITLAAVGAADRRARWLLLAGLIVLAACLGSPFFVSAWVAIPFMDRIQHVLAFYSQYGQLILVLLGATGLDALLRPASPRTRRLALWVCGAGIVLAATSLAALSPALVRDFTELNARANLRAALVLGAACVLLLAMARATSERGRGRALAALLLLVVLDLGAYFHNASRADMAFTSGRQGMGWRGVHPNEHDRATLRKPWGPYLPEKGFDGDLADYMPIKNDLWPRNYFLWPAELPSQFSDHLLARTRSAPPFVFYDGFVAAPGMGPMPEAFVTHPDIDRELLVAGAPGGSPASTRITEGFEYRWKHLDYNGFEVEVVAPRDGWLLVRQLYDRQWRVHVDGAPVAPRKANYVSMAIHIARGRHVMRWEYRPLARAIYWPAAAGLELVVAGLLTLAWAASPAPARRA